MYSLHAWDVDGIKRTRACVRCLHKLLHSTHCYCTRFCDSVPHERSEQRLISPRDIIDIAIVFLPVLCDWTDQLLDPSEKKQYTADLTSSSNSSILCGVRAPAAAGVAGSAVPRSRAISAWPVVARASPANLTTTTCPRQTSFCCRALFH
jgi:hypothetical protein